MSTHNRSRQMPSKGEPVSEVEPPNGDQPGRMSRRRLFEAGAGVMLSGSFLAACGESDNAPSGGGGGGGQASKGGKIGLTLNGVVPYTQCVTTGVYKALDGTNYDLVVLDSQFDTSKELSNIQSLISQRVKGIVVQPNTTQSVTRGALLAQKAGIPVTDCLVPGPFEGDKYLAGVVNPQNERGGQMIAEWLTKNVPEGGEVIVVQGVLGQGFSEQLDKGLDAGFAQAGGKFKVVTRQPGNFDRKTAIDVVQNGLKAHPNAKIIVDYAAAMGNGISTYLKGAGRKDIVHVTSDADDELVKWLKTPYCRATRYYSAAQTGELAAKKLIEAIETGKKKVDPYSSDAEQSIRTGKDIGQAIPFCNEKYRSQVAKI